jgi:hypothetical protein
MTTRFFNTAGPCNPAWHYTVDPLPRLPEVRGLIEQKSYFVIHAPRQSGKTTYLKAMMQVLNREGRYTALQVNIQSAASGRDPDHAMQIVAAAIYRAATEHLPQNEWPAKPVIEGWAPAVLQEYLYQWSMNCPKPIVLFVDEADSLQDENFLALLRQLRSGFESRPDHFPQSIALVGLRDVRDYKIGLRPDSASLGTGSPFNIKTKSLFMEGFGEQEVNALMDLHQESSGQQFSHEVRGEIYRLTQGQPWLTNALLNEIVAGILQNDFSRQITVELVTQARERLIARRDTHLDSLVDKLREERVRQVVIAVINGTIPNFDTYNDAVLYCRDLGIIAARPPVRFANPIYQEIIPRTLSFGFQESIPQDYVEQSAWYIRQGRLDMDALLQAFQKFYRRHSQAWLGKFDFREVGRQLLLMAFLQRIINGGGRIEREMAVGNGRSDLVIYFGDDCFVLELKLNYDAWSEEDGLQQLAAYLDRLGEGRGYLILFELESSKSWEERIRWQTRQQDGKNLTLVGM